MCVYIYSPQSFWVFGESQHFQKRAGEWVKFEFSTLVEEKSFNCTKSFHTFSVWALVGIIGALFFATLFHPPKGNPQHIRQYWFLPTLNYHIGDTGNFLFNIEFYFTVKKLKFFPSTQIFSFTTPRGYAEYSCSCWQGVRWT